MKIGVLGGTFNPIHNSHLHIGREYTQQLSLDRLLLVPSRIPPHKSPQDLASPEDRLEMCRLAAAELPKCSVVDFEAVQAGKSYTYKTLEYLQGQYPGDTLYLLMGSDMFLTLQNWKNPEMIFRLAVLCAARRERGEGRKLEQHRELLETMGASCVIIDAEAKPLSSTFIRACIRRGESPGEYLPPAVWAHIRQRGLYKGEMQ